MKKRKAKWIKNPGYQPEPGPMDGPALLYNAPPVERRDVLLYDKAAVRESLREARRRHTQRVKSNFP